MTPLLEQMIRRGASSLALRVMKNEADRYGSTSSKFGVNLETAKGGGAPIRSRLTAKSKSRKVHR
jgi:hypothetical protein